MGDWRSSHVGLVPLPRCWAVTRDVGRLGLGAAGDDEPGVVDLPREVPRLTGKAVTRVSVGSRHALAVTDDRGTSEVWSWGDNSYGQCGQGKKAPPTIDEPKRIAMLKSHGVRGDCGGYFRNVVVSWQYYGCVVVASWPCLDACAYSSHNGAAYTRSRSWSWL